MNYKKIIAVIPVLFLLTFISCGQNKESDTKSTVTFQSVGADDLSKVMNDVVILDVRTEGEFQTGHIAKAINMDVTSGDFEQKIQELDKTKDIYVYCRSGVRSKKAAQIMINNGFTNVYDLDGGLISWERAKKELTNN